MDNLSFSDDTASKTGKNRRTVDRSISLAEGISDRVAAQLEGSKLANNRNELAKLAKLPEAEQVDSTAWSIGRVLSRVAPIERTGDPTAARSMAYYAKHAKERKREGGKRGGEKSTKAIDAKTTHCENKGMMNSSYPCNSSENTARAEAAAAVGVGETSVRARGRTADPPPRWRKRTPVLTRAPTKSVAPFTACCPEGVSTRVDPSERTHAPFSSTVWGLAGPFGANPGETGEIRPNHHAPRGSRHAPRGSRVTPRYARPTPRHTRTPRGLAGKC